MKLLLTSAGITNDSIRAELLSLLGKPIEECRALCIPTAGYAHPSTDFTGPWRFVSGRDTHCPMVELGWASVGVLELTTLPTLGRDFWLPRVEAVDVLLANGGDAMYLAHWLRESGLAEVLPTLDSVYVGFSAGSMALTPRMGADFLQWPAPEGDQGLGLVEFSLFPHVEHPMLPENTMAAAEQWAAELGSAAYAIDDDTAISVTDTGVKVVSEGVWREFPAE